VQETHLATFSVLTLCLAGIVGLAAGAGSVIHLHDPSLTIPMAICAATVLVLVGISHAATGVTSAGGNGASQPVGRQ
jgi:hypothetical protein